MQRVRELEGERRNKGTRRIEEGERVDGEFIAEGWRRKDTRRIEK